MLSWESLHSIPVGGLSAHVTELADALQRRGHEVHVFTRMGQDQPRYSCIGSVHYHRCPFDPHADFMTYVGRMGDAMFERVRAAEDFYGQPFDVVHGHDWLAVPALGRVKRELGRRITFTIHSTEYGRCGNQFCDGRARTIRDTEWYGTYLADRVVCVSRALADEVQRIYSTPAEKVAVIYNGIDPHRFDGEVDAAGVRRSFGIGEEDPLVLFVGRLTWQKGPDLLLGAIPEVLRHRPETRFVFVGDGDMRPALEGQASAAGLFNSVRFLGTRNGDELVRLFKSADAVCVPSRNEPFGIVVLEAWSATQPVIVTCNGGPREFVRDQETGWVVDPNRQSLGWALGTALVDQSNARRIAANGRHEAETRFSWDAIGAGMEQVYASA
jgi:glycosyltransferase involved in cell wall biosynthesis